MEVVGLRCQADAPQSLIDVRVDGELVATITLPCSCREGVPCTLQFRERHSVVMHVGDRCLRIRFAVREPPRHDRGSVNTERGQCRATVV